MSVELPQVQLGWETFMGALFDKTVLFPKVMRYTLTNRVEGTAVEVLELLVDARYGTGATRSTALKEVDRRLARLRALLRFAHSRRALDTAALGRLVSLLDDVGRQVGGWQRHERGRQGAE